MKALARKTISAAILGTAMLGASALAAQPGPPPACSTTADLGIPVISCSGFSEGNLVNVGHKDDAAALLGLIGIMSNGIPIANASISGATTLSFTQALYGLTVIGIHIGGGSDHDGHVKESTAFYKFDAGTTGIHSITTRFDTLSNAGLYKTMAAPVPEPGTYAMLLAGVGLLGAVARRRKT